MKEEAPNTQDQKRRRTWCWYHKDKVTWKSTRGRRVSCWRSTQRRQCSSRELSCTLPILHVTTLISYGLKKMKFLKTEERK